MSAPRHLGAAGRFARIWINSKLTPLLIAVALMAGVFAVWKLPREEEPQIVVPMADVSVTMAGASAREVEERVTKPMEKLLWEIPGVEYIYSTSSPGSSLVIVRFLVGQDEEKSIVRLNQKLLANYDLIPPGASQPLVKPRTIDDVPILAITLWSRHYGDYELRQIAAQVADTIKQVPDVSTVTLIGGQRRQLQVTLDVDRLKGYALTPAAIVNALRASNQRVSSGSLDDSNREVLLETGEFLRSSEDARRVVVSVFEGKPVFLRDVANITDGGEEPIQYVRYRDRRGFSAPAVTISIAKRRGTNAVVVAGNVMKRVNALKDAQLPGDVEMTLTRNYGETAAEKSNELLRHMLLAVVFVSVLIAVTLGRRESAIVFIAIPVTLALTLAVFYLYGYTLNRITLFALIFSIGILVDDAIVVVENIARHWRKPENHGRAVADVAIEAVDEVGNPTLLATLAVIAAILPMAFVGGLMGPYMRPIPVGASAAMAFSVVVAFVVTPWAAIRILKRPGSDEAQEEREDWFTRRYRQIMHALLHRPAIRWSVLAGVAGLLLGSVSLFYFGAVKVKMLPFDNKSEFQVIVDMPNGTTLEQTQRVAEALASEAAKQPEVVNIQTYAGIASPFNFNGLVRHYYLRRGANVADIQVNLTGKAERSLQSHEIAKQVRLRLLPVAQKFGARMKVAEAPPGPPVLETMVAEIYGPTQRGQIELARQIHDIFRRTDGVVDSDWYVEDDQMKYRLIVDKEKAAIEGISDEEVARTIQTASAGFASGLLHADSAKEDVPMIVRLKRADRSSLDRLLSLRVQGKDGKRIPLSELVHWEQGTIDKSIYHKNLMPVTYVTADLAGAIESPVYAVLQIGPEIDKLKAPGGYSIEQHMASLPDTTARYSMKWDGEWHITYEVFRDLGLAFAVVLVLIYGLLVGWFKSLVTPLVIMAAIPFSLIGIVPAHGALYAFFTATSMIGFIAGAGIVVRNSIILVDFIEQRLAAGMPLDEAVVEAGAVRFRPMMLTAAAVVAGSAVILFDPIFQGLAIALMAGEVASLAFSRMTVPVVYFLVNRRAARHLSKEIVFS
jgi:multidrug efflux pump subunit AcrB